jgi:hypothetical protein
MSAEQRRQAQLLRELNEQNNPLVHSQAELDRFWEARQREIRPHRRRMRELDPCDLGVYEVPRFHGSEDDYRR